MPIKKKVKFNDKKEFKRYDKETESDQSGDEPSNQSDDESSSKKVKHSLDSDEEDNTQKYEALNRDVFKGLRQINTFLQRNLSLILSLNLRHWTRG